MLTLALPLAWYGYGAVLSLLAVGGGLAWREVRRSVHLVWQGDDTWWWAEGTAAAVAARLLPDSYLSQPLIVLCFRLADGRRRSLPLLADSLDADTLRRLRARLKRWKGPQSGQAVAG